MTTTTKDPSAVVAAAESPAELLDQMALALANVPDWRHATSEAEKQARLTRAGALRAVQSELHGLTFNWLPRADARLAALDRQREQVAEMVADLTRERDAVAAPGDDPALRHSRRDACEAFALGLAFMHGEARAGSTAPPAVTSWLAAHGLVALPRLAFVEKELAEARAHRDALLVKLADIRARWQSLRA